MSEIKVKNCQECPFCEYHYDDFALGDSELYICGLLKYLNQDYFLEKEKLEEVHTTCPLKQSSYLIKL